MYALRCLGLVAVFFLASPLAHAQEIKAGDLVITQAWSRATPKGSPVGAGYLTIHNNGSTAERLTGGASDAVGDVQVHEMSMDNGVMKMRQLASGLEIPPGATVELKPGGYHLMLMNLKQPLARGDMLKITLDFQRAGKTPVDFKVGGIGDTGPAKSSDMKDMKMDHGDMKMNH